ESSPQHWAEPLGRMPHVWFAPAATATNAPLGGTDCPDPLFPQHTRVPSLRIAQACPPPADIPPTRQPAVAVSFQVVTIAMATKAIPMHRAVTRWIASQSNDGIMGLRFARRATRS